MNCSEFLRRLSDYADGKIEIDVCRELEQHLRDCPPCEDMQHDLDDLARLCRDAPTPRMPDDLRRRIERLLAGGGRVP